MLARRTQSRAIKCVSTQGPGWCQSGHTTLPLTPEPYRATQITGVVGKRCSSATDWQAGGRNVRPFRQAEVSASLPALVVLDAVAALGVDARTHPSTARCGPDRLAGCRPTGAAQPVRRYRRRPLPQPCGGCDEVAASLAQTDTSPIGWQPAQNEEFDLAIRPRALVTLSAKWGRCRAGCW